MVGVRVFKYINGAVQRLGDTNLSLSVERLHIAGLRRYLMGFGKLGYANLLTCYLVKFSVDLFKLFFALMLLQFCLCMFQVTVIDLFAAEV